MVGARGLADYTCAGCNNALSQYVQNNPDVANLPIFGGSGNAVATPSGAAGQGASATTGAAAGDTTQNGCGSLWNPQNWHCAIIGSFAGRFVYGLVGLLMIAMAVFIYALRTRDQG